MLDKALKIFFVSSLFFFFSVGGMVLGIFDVEPARSLRLGISVADHLYKTGSKKPADPLDPEYALWTPVRKDWDIHFENTEQAQEGYTLLSDLTKEEARLISMDGELLHRWSLPLAEIWDSEDIIPKPNISSLYRWQKVRLFPDGSLMAVLAGTEISPYGSGLIYLDKDSNLIWKFLDHAHHDFDIGPDGRIYVLTHKIVEETPEEAPWTLRAPYLGEELVVLSPEGEELERYDLLQAMLSSPMTGVPFLIPEKRGGDHFHANNVDYVTAEDAAAHPYAKEGQILLSFREMDLLALFDPADQSMPWALVGSWRRQHDPDLLPNGNILVYDNNGRLLSGNHTRVLEINPQTLDVEWLYQGSESDFFHNTARGSQQRLENGNTLITDSYAGRIFEVTPGGEKVWQYWNRSYETFDGVDYIGSLRGGLRFKPDELDFPFNYGEINAAIASR